VELLPNRARLFVLCSATLVIAADAATQDSAQTAPAAGWVWASSIGVIGVGQQIAGGLESMVVGLNVTRNRVSAPVFDAAFGTVPYLAAQGLILIGARAGVAVPLAVSNDLAFIPSAGGSALTIQGEALLTGINGGLAIRTRDTSGAGLRLGITWHKFARVRSMVWLAEIGVVLR
jgi:hypothetical protein